MMRTVKVQLSTPVKLGSEAYSFLEFREPKAKDLRSLPVKMETMGPMLDLAADLAGVSSNVINDLTMEDMSKVMNVVQDFMDGGQATETK